MQTIESKICTSVPRECICIVKAYLNCTTSENVSHWLYNISILASNTFLLHLLQMMTPKILQKYLFTLSSNFATLKKKYIYLYIKQKFYVCESNLQIGILYNCNKRTEYSQINTTIVHFWNEILHLHSGFDLKIIK